MTKKQLLESELFKAIPDNTELVFNTSFRAEDCIPVKESDLTFRSEIVGWAQKNVKLREEGIDEKEPIYKNFLVTNTNPY